MRVNKFLMQFELVFRLVMSIHHIDHLLEFLIFCPQNVGNMTATSHLK